LLESAVTDDTSDDKDGVLDEWTDDIGDLVIVWGCLLSLEPRDIS